MRPSRYVMLLGLMIVTSLGYSTTPKLIVVLSFDLENAEGVGNVPLILAILKEHEANATFFVTGKMSEEHTDVVKRIKDGGYEIGSHGYDHEFPIFEKKDALLFASIFNKTFEYEWNRSVKTEENYENLLRMSREAIKNTTGTYPRSYRSPILTPSYTKNMRYMNSVEKAGFSIDSSLSRRYIEPGMLGHNNSITLIPVSFSDGELLNTEFLEIIIIEHARRKYPLVIVAHPLRFSDEEHILLFKNLLVDIERKYKNVEYLSVEDYVSLQLRSS